MKTLLKNAKVVTPEGILENTDILIEKGRISAIAKNIKKCDNTIELNNQMVIPGFIDIHSDMIESFIEPRSTALFDFEMSLKEVEKQLILSGITTMYHSISLYKKGAWGSKKIRQPENVKKLAQHIDDIHKAGHLIHHRLHLRYEIDNRESYEDVEELIQSNKINLLSFMDHSPGQGQYKNLEIYKKHLPDQGSNMDDQEFTNHMEGEAKKETLIFPELLNMAKLAKHHNIPVASHDDDTEAKIKLNQELGISISEFPINVNTAYEACKAGMMTVLGAPNILLGGSHSGNLSAADAIMQDLCHILCSDYYPPSMLHSIFYMEKKYNYPVHKMVNMLSLNPAKAVGIDKDYGSIELGKYADLLVVSEGENFKSLNKVFIHGEEISSLAYRI